MSHSNKNNNRKQGVFYCSNCGARVGMNDSFCPICGNRIDSRIYEDESYYVEEKANTDVNKEYDNGSDGSTTGRNIGVIGALSIIASVFLPFVSYSILGFGESIQLIERDDGIIFLISGIIALLIFCSEKKVLSLIASFVLCGLAYFEYQGTIETLDEMGLLAGLVHKQAGFYLMIVGAAFLALGAIVNLFDK